MKEKEARVFQNTVFWIFWPFLLFVWEIQSDKAARMPTGIRRFFRKYCQVSGFPVFMRSKVENTPQIGIDPETNELGK